MSSHIVSLKFIIQFETHWECWLGGGGDGITPEHVFNQASRNVSVNIFGLIKRIPASTYLATPTAEQIQNFDPPKYWICYGFHNVFANP